ncbi:MAG: DUF5916 domain-containing protein [Fidelibacterota bacterium]
MKKIWLLFFPPALILCNNQSLDAENDISREIVAQRLAVPLKIDGKLNEALYSTPPNQQFIQDEPDNGEPVTEKTDVWVAYDNSALYIGARLWDSKPDSIVKRMVRRDEDANSDLFAVGVDSYHDLRSGFFFVVNPVGAIQDGTISNDSWFDDTWDGIWEMKTRIDDQGWTVEMKIPFSQLRFNKLKEYTWGINFRRYLQRRNEVSAFIYTPRGESGFVSRFAVLRGIKNITPPQRIEFTPYLTSGYSLLPSLEDNPFFKGKDSKLGIGTDVKLGIGNDLTVDATINPDFGQVEVDPSTINLSAYETYYEEKRPFFVEGSSIFSFGTGGPSNRWGFNFGEPDFFYSRRIGRPPQGSASGEWVDTPSATRILGAAKISGKLKGDWSLGGLSVVTNREFTRVNNSGEIHKQEVEPLTYYNLLRIQKEFNKGLQGLGGLGTAVKRNFKDRSLRSSLSDDALAIGLDGWTFFNQDREWVIAGWIGGTQVSGSKNRMLSLQENSSHYFQRPDADHVEVDSNLTVLNGMAGRVMLNKEKGHWRFNTALGVITPGFESNDLGLNFGTDVINNHIVLGYEWYDPGEIFRRLTLNTAYVTNHNFGGIKTSEMIFVFGWAQFLNYWNVNFFSGWGPTTLSARHLRGGPLVESPSGSFYNFGFNSDGRKDIVFGGGGNGSNSADGSNGWSVYSWISVKIGTRLNLEFNPNYRENMTIAQYVTQIEDPGATSMYGKRYVMAQLDQQTLSADIRVDYTFTPTLTLQAYFQPFIAVGKYSRFKEFKRPRSYDFLVYGEEGSTIQETESGYFIDPTGGDDQDAFEISNQDFNYKALVGNAVLRWEFHPGSTLYLVWTRNGNNFDHPGQFKLNRDLGKLLKAKTDNVFEIKITYWIGA